MTTQTTKPEKKRSGSEPEMISQRPLELNVAPIFLLKVKPKKKEAMQAEKEEKTRLKE